MVTAEIAIGVMTIVFLTFLAAWSVMLVVVQTRCGDVAAEVARQVARGDGAAARKAEDSAPAGARVDVQRDASHVAVTVRASSSFAGLPAVALVGRSVASLEPGVSR